MTGPHGVVPESRLKQSVALPDDARMRERSLALRRRFALLSAALAVSAPTQGAPVAADMSKNQADEKVSWLSPSDQELLRRSYLRCLGAQYARIGDAQHEALLVAAFHRDLEHFTLLVSRDDVKRAPRVVVSQVPHIGCDWFNDGSATAR
jgi:hypothetical protein